MFYLLQLIIIIIRNTRGQNSCFSAGNTRGQNRYFSAGKLWPIMFDWDFVSRGTDEAVYPSNRQCYKLWKAQIFFYRTTIYGRYAILKRIVLVHIWVMNCRLCLLLFTYTIFGLPDLSFKVPADFRLATAFLRRKGTRYCPIKASHAEKPSGDWKTRYVIRRLD